jgi:GH24 family phage-related lysozyme (muramidase)
MAVGWYHPYDPVGSSGPVPLAEHWDGKHWTIPAQQPHVPPAEGGAALKGVSCTAPAACVAVGDREPDVGGAPEPLAERWDGNDWTLITPASPAVAKPTDASLFLSNQLFGISCSSATACTAVGRYDAPDDDSASGMASHPWALRWNGSSWTTQAVQQPSLGQLVGVSCVSATDCTAVGHVPDYDTGQPLAEHWDGTTWAQQQTGGRTAGEFNSVACTAPLECNAVGELLEGGGVEAGLVAQHEATASATQVSAAEAQEIARSEGLEPRPKADPAHNCTIGYGHKLHDGPCTRHDSAEYPHGVTQLEAADKLKIDAADKAADVERIIGRPLTQQQLDALVDLAFNLRKFARSGVVRAVKLNQSPAEIAAAFNRLVYATDAQTGEKVRYRGLVDRRAREANLYNNGVHFPIAPQKNLLTCTELSGLPGPLPSYPSCPASREVAPTLRTPSARLSGASARRAPATCAAPARGA